LSVVVRSVGGVIGIEPEVFTTPRDHLENAAFARKLMGHYQAIELEQLADYARAITGLDESFAHLDVAAPAAHLRPRRPTPPALRRHVDLPAAQHDGIVEAGLD
jgi:hypothetical protein